tara:strand:+ start:1203 stop:2168 length:966 start_codon:yes stop_codon:yes gene_type:complete
MSSILKVDTINEVTSANGVTVDGLSIKDSKLVTANSVVTTNVTDANITSGKIADDAVTLAKMASGTDGNIISYDASGNPVAVATGSSGQVLTSAGAGAVPSFQAATVPDNAITLAKMASGTDGNLITYDASGNPAAVATGSSGQVLTSAGAGAPPTFATLSAESNTPSFYAFGDGATSIPNATLQTISVQNERFDSGGCYNATSSTATLNSISVPAYRFGPNVGGLYYFIGAVRITGTGSGSWNLGLVNNLGGTGGTETYASLKYFASSSDNNTLMIQGYSVMNGSGNNMVLTAYQESGGTLTTSDAIYTTYFGGFLVKKS